MRAGIERAGFRPGALCLELRSNCEQEKGGEGKSHGASEQLAVYRLLARAGLGLKECETDMVGGFESFESVASSVYQSASFAKIAAC